MADFPGVITTFARGLQAKIAASTVVSAAHRMYTDELGNLYVGDGTTQLKSLASLVSRSRRRPVGQDEIVVNMADKGVATANSDVVNAAAINAVLATLGTTPTRLLFPSTVPFSTTGGHVVPRYVHIDAHGTQIAHTGNNVCFKFQSGLSAFGGFFINSFEGRISGTSAGLGGVEWGNQWGFMLGWRTYITGYSNGFGIKMNNVNNWTEGSQIAGQIRSCAVGLKLARSTGTDSFAYTELKGLSIDVPDNGVGIDLGSDATTSMYVYNGDFAATIWLHGDNNTAVALGPNTATDTSRWAIRGEIIGTHTGNVGLSIPAGGTFKGYGSVEIKGASNSFGGTSVRLMPFYRPIDMKSGTDGTGRFTALLSDNPDVSHQTQFGSYSYTDNNTPYVAGYDQSKNALLIYKVPFGATPGASGQLVGRFNINGVYFPGGGSTGGLFSGTGNPEGVVTAGAGNLYVRSDAAGSRLSVWVKITGSGNTGWKPLRNTIDARISAEGLTGENFPRANTQNAFAAASGTVWAALAGLGVGDVVNSVVVDVEAAASGLTLAKVGLFNSTGTLMASSADIKSQLTAAGPAVLALSAPYTVPSPDSPRWYFGLLQVGTTPATIRVGATFATAAGAAAIGSGFPVAASIGTGQADIQTGAVTAYRVVPWVGWL